MDDAIAIRRLARDDLAPFCAAGKMAFDHTVRPDLARGCTEMLVIAAAGHAAARGPYARTWARPSSALVMHDRDLGPDA